jgi:hypothetical protein
MRSLEMSETTTTPASNRKTTTIRGITFSFTSHQSTYNKTGNRSDDYFNVIILEVDPEFKGGRRDKLIGDIDVDHDNCSVPNCQCRVFERGGTWYRPSFNPGDRYDRAHVVLGNDDTLEPMRIILQRSCEKSPRRVKK